MDGFKTKVLAVTNQKGGVGKTTTTANIAYALAKLGRDVLCIDFDSQASLTNYLNVGIGEEEDYYGIYELMLSQFRKIEAWESEELATISFDDLIKKCICRPKYVTRELRAEDGQKKVVDVPQEFGFDLLPSHLNLADFELELSSTNATSGQSNGFRLYNVVNKILKIHEYDYILIDCNPSLGVMAMNAITAAVDGVLIPTNLDLMSTRGVRTLIDKIADVQEALYRATDGKVQHMGVVGVVLNLYSERRSVDKTIQNDMERFYPFTIFESTIPESINAKKALFAGVIYSQMYPKAAEAYLALAKEIEKQIANMKEEGMQIRRLDSGLSTGVLEEDMDNEQ